MDVEEVHGLPVQEFIVDLNQYVITCESDDEAHYLCGMLNSRRVNEAITADQTHGQFGPRDIHRPVHRLRAVAVWVVLESGKLLR